MSLKAETKDNGNVSLPWYTDHDRFHTVEVRERKEPWYLHKLYHGRRFITSEEVTPKNSTVYRISAVGGKT